ncbi:MAG: transglutaminase family protein [Thermodesulfobacteriota bacterium]
MRGLWAAAVVCLALFLGLFGFRLGLFSGMVNRKPVTVTGQTLPDRETWMKILQNDSKIGYSHSIFSNREDHYSLAETLFLQVGIMGLTHRVNLHTEAILNRDLTLRSFDSRLRSGPFEFSATGRVEDKTLVVTAVAEGKPSEIRLPLSSAPYLSAGLAYAVCNSGMAPKDTLSVPLFDPSSMAVVPIRVTVEEKEDIVIMGMKQAATRLLIEFKGARQQVWISENGEVLRESGLMGLVLEKTDKHLALERIEGGRGDLTEMLAITSNVTFDAPEKLEMLKVKIEGIDTASLALAGGRQALSGQELTVTSEDLVEQVRAEEPEKNLEDFLQPDALIQSDDPAIRQLAAEIVAPGGSPREQAERLMRWVYENIDKKPVVSMPNALSTLTHRQGDCNEHAMLLAALARAAGIPAQVETGLVYLKGKFFYHAWNRLYAGRWITADATFGQMPADVTHIRLAGGRLDQQLDLIPVIGNIRLTVIDYKPTR